MNRRHLRAVEGRLAGASPERAGGRDRRSPAPARDGTANGEVTPRDEAVCLLHAAAEVQHALIVQYLYAAFSLQRDQARMSGPRVPDNAGRLVSGWFATILSVAREEATHLLTIQNILLLVGGPLHLDREEFPSRSGLHPYTVELERLTRTSLAKYAAAETRTPPPPGTERLVEEVRSRLAADRLHLERAGALYARLIEVIGGLDKKDFDPSTVDWQVGADEWPPAGTNQRVRVCPDRRRAVAALEAIAAHGEGPARARRAPGSHLDRLLKIYTEFPETERADGGAPPAWQPSRAVATNPNTSSPPRGALSEDELADEQAREPGRITDPTTRLWAQLLNVRYRMLLATIAHALTMRRTRAVPRDVLVDWAFDEMRAIGLLLGRLVELPLKAGGRPEVAAAGAPFEMPYTLALPEREADRWRLHHELIRASDRLVQALRRRPDLSDPTGILDMLLTGNDGEPRRQAIVGEIAASRPCDGYGAMCPS